MNDNNNKTRMNDMSTLLNHCGASRVSLDELNQLDSPVPYTDTHYPIRHDLFVDLAKDVLHEGGYRIKTEEYSLIQKEDTDNMFGLITLENGYDDAGRVVGLRNSGSMHFLAQLGAGDHVFVCDNLVFTAQIIVGRKHTKHIMRDLPNQMTHAVHRLGEEFRKQEGRREIYKETELSDANAHDIMIRTMELKKPQGIPGSKLSAWVNEYRNPSHEEFLYGTAWGLQNAFTEVAKDWGVATMQNRTEGLIRTLDGAIGFEEKYLAWEAN